MDALRYSIAPPPPHWPMLGDEFSDEESQAATNDDAPDVAQLDPDVGPASLPEGFLAAAAYQFNSRKTPLQLMLYDDASCLEWS